MVTVAHLSYCWALGSLCNVIAFPSTPWNHIKQIIVHCSVAYKPPFDVKILSYCYNAVIDCYVFACAVLVLLVIVYMRCLQHPAVYGSGLDQHDDVRENIIHYDEEGVGECGRCLWVVLIASHPAVMRAEWDKSPEIVLVLLQLHLSYICICLPFSQIFPTIDSLPAPGLTPRLYDWSVSSEHLGFYF